MRNKILPIGLLLVIMMAVFWRLIMGDVMLNTGVVYSDWMMFNYPLKELYRQMLLAGKLPFWTHLIGNGYPLFAEGQVGALYPFNLILFRMFDALTAVNITIIFHYFLAAATTYLFCNISLKLTRSGAFLAALVYSLSGFYATHIHQINLLMVVAYLPLSLMCVERMVVTKKWVWSFVLAIVFALQITAGYFELVYYSGVLSGLFLLLLAYIFNPGSGVKPVLLFGVAGILGVGMAAAQLLPTFELTQFSSRQGGLGFEHASATVWPLSKLVMFVNPYAYDIYEPEQGYHPMVDKTVNVSSIFGYVGILPLALAVGAMFTVRKKYAFLFTGLLIFSFVYAFGRSTQLFALVWEVVPGLKYFRFPVKILFFIEFCLGILAAYGWERFRPKKFPWVVYVMLVIVALDLTWNSVRLIYNPVPSKTWFSKVPVAEFLREKLAGTDYRYYGHGTNNLDYKLARDLQMQTEFRNLLPVDYNLIHNLPSNRDWVGLFLPRQQKLNSMGMAINMDRASLTPSDEFMQSVSMQGVKYLVSDLPLENPDLELIKMEPFSRTVNHLVYFKDNIDIPSVPAKGTYVYENKAVLPRVVFSAGAAEISSYEDTKVVIKVKADRDGVLALSDTYYPGWKVYVDGKENRVLLANDAFRGVEVPAGEHEIVWKFESTYWKIGKTISVVSIIILIALIILINLRKK